MMGLTDRNTPEGTNEATDLAHMLLEHAELPLYFRVRAHIVLDCGKTSYLHHAQEAVRFAEMGRDLYGPGKTSESRVAVEGLLWEARETLRRAEQELKDLKKRTKAGEVKWKKGEKLPYGNINDDHDKQAPSLQPEKILSTTTTRSQCNREEYGVTTGETTCSSQAKIKADEDPDTSD